MLNPRAVAAMAILMVAAGCSQNASVPVVGPPPPTTTPSAVPTATPAAHNADADAHGHTHANPYRDA